MCVLTRTTALTAILKEVKRKTYLDGGIFPLVIASHIYEWRRESSSWRCWNLANSSTSVKTLEAEPVMKPLIAGKLNELGEGNRHKGNWTSLCVVNLNARLTQ